MTDSEPSIVALDVDYRDGFAIAAGVWFRGWKATSAEFSCTRVVSPVSEYLPGEFYRRELPCLMAILAIGPRPDIVAIDGYVWLGTDRPGLGMHLHEVCGADSTIVGIAKTRFAGSGHAVAVVRGESSSPIYVTAIGIDATVAAECVRTMSGPFRIPTLLRQVDRLAREADPQRV